MSKDERRACLFDLDGTITDPAKGLLGSVRYALESLGRQDLSAQDLGWMIGPALRELFGRLLGRAEIAEEALALYRAEYARAGMFEFDVIPGMPELMMRLAAEGQRVFVATAKPHVYAIPIIDRLGLASIVEAVYGPELDGTNDDKRVLVRKLVDERRVEPRKSAMIGDRRFDMLAASANGMRAVGVAWGYGSTSELAEAGADVVCASVADLERMLVA